MSDQKLAPVPSKGGFYSSSSSSDNEDEEQKHPQQLIEDSKQDERRDQILQLEQKVQEYKSKLAQLDRLLKTEEEVREDGEKKEELEKLREQLLEGLISQQNQMKFLINEAAEIGKSTHCDKVCEAFFQQEQRWYAAVTLDVFEAEGLVEIAWIGMNLQEKLPKKYVTVLTAPDPAYLFEGAQCNAILAAEGMWYPCVVEKALQEREETQDLAPDLKARFIKYLVKFKLQNTKASVPLDYIRITKDQILQNERRKATGEDQGEAVGDFQVPEHLKVKRSDTEKQRQQKKKKVKALKYSHKVRQQEHESRQRQSVWQDFNEKAQQKKQGYFAAGKSATESIFKSPDSIFGRVGVVGSGREMTTYDNNRLKYSQLFKDKKEPGGAPGDAKRRKFM